MKGKHNVRSHAQAAVSLQTLRAREEGQGMVEYALILVLVSVVAILALTGVGENVVDRLRGDRSRPALPRRRKGLP